MPDYADDSTARAHLLRVLQSQAMTRSEMLTELRFTAPQRDRVVASLVADGLVVVSQERFGYRQLTKTTYRLASAAGAEQLAPASKGVS
jgi:hypothetical protein